MTPASSPLQVARIDRTVIAAVNARNQRQLQGWSVFPTRRWVARQERSDGRGVLFRSTANGLKCNRRCVRACHPIVEGASHHSPHAPHTTPATNGSEPTSPERKLEPVCFPSIRRSPPLLPEPAHFEAGHVFVEMISSDRIGRSDAEFHAIADSDADPSL